MKHKIIIAVLTLVAGASILGLPQQIEAREVAFTFDDCPRKSGPLFAPMKRAQQMTAALKAANITAAFFCNSPSRGVGGLERLKYFASQGHLIANHTADHPDFYRTSSADFIQNIDRADVQLKNLPNFRKWFRFPYLREGKNPEDVEAVRHHLKQIGYINGYITIDNEDWYVDEALRRKLASGHSYDRSRLCQTYARILTENGEHFDKMSVKALGRSVKHVLLLHETDLNAICLPTVIEAFKKQNWTFISPDDAYRDPIAATEPKATTKLNGGRVTALALEAGYRGPLSTKWSKETEMDKELEAQNVWQ